MSRRPSTFAEPLFLAFLLTWQTHAGAQACCAGAGTVTPGRLALHERVLVGVQVKGAAELGSFDARARFAGSPARASELDLEQDWFAALRVLERAQVALLLPILETRRANRGLSEFGGGLGDINLNLRYDFTLAGASRVIPGIAGLGGITFPSGKPSDAQGLRPLATDATGVGAFQGNIGLAVEQAFGPWLVNLTGMVAARSARSVASSGITVHEHLASQWSLLGSMGYVFANESALALSAAYATEGSATIDDQSAQGSGHRLTTVTAFGLLPLSDTWRVQSAAFVNPPLSHSSLNQTAFGGLLFTVVHSWI
jgi:hypothetical protein